MLKQADQQVSPRCAKNHPTSSLIASASTFEENTNSMTNIVIPVCLTIVIFGVLIGAVWHIWWVKTKRPSKNQVSPSVGVTAPSLQQPFCICAQSFFLPWMPVAPFSNCSSRTETFFLSSWHFQILHTTHWYKNMVQSSKQQTNNKQTTKNT